MYCCGDYFRTIILFSIRLKFLRTFGNGLEFRNERVFVGAGKGSGRLERRSLEVLALKNFGAFGKSSRVSLIQGSLLLQSGDPESEVGCECLYETRITELLSLKSRRGIYGILRSKLRAILDDFYMYELASVDRS